jgi:hypothetical protein
LKPWTAHTVQIYPVVTQTQICKATTINAASLSLATANGICGVTNAIGFSVASFLADAFKVREIQFTPLHEADRRAAVIYTQACPDFRIIATTSI